MYWWGTSSLFFSTKPRGWNYLAVKNPSSVYQELSSAWILLKIRTSRHCFSTFMAYPYKMLSRWPQSTIGHVTLQPGLWKNWMPTEHFVSMEFDMPLNNFETIIRWTIIAHSTRFWGGATRSQKTVLGYRENGDGRFKSTGQDTRSQGQRSLCYRNDWQNT